MINAIWNNGYVFVDVALLNAIGYYFLRYFFVADAAKITDIGVVRKNVSNQIGLNDNFAINEILSSGLSDTKHIKL